MRPTRPSPGAPFMLAAATAPTLPVRRSLFPIATQQPVFTPEEAFALQRRRSFSSPLSSSSSSPLPRPAPGRRPSSAIAGEEQKPFALGVVGGGVDARTLTPSAPSASSAFSVLPLPSYTARQSSDDEIESYKTVVADIDERKIRKGAVLDLPAVICGERPTRLLGRGAYGRVYETNKGQAIKIQNTGSSAESIHPSLAREIFFLRMMNNPYIAALSGITPSCKAASDKFVREHDVKESDAERDRRELSEGMTMGMLMPRYTATLYDVLNSPAWQNDLSHPPATSAIKGLRFKFAHDLLCALRALHSYGIMHLDVKPENILIELTTNSGDGDAKTESVRAVLSDYGLAQWIKGKRSLTRSIDRLGTSIYRDIAALCDISGEEEGYYGPEFDVWSFGVTLFEIFFGSFPFNFAAHDNDSLVRGITASHFSPAEMSRLTADKKSASAEHCNRLTSALPARSLEESKWLHKEEIKTRYYTPSEYKAIWQVIDACLQFDTRKRPTMSQLASYELFRDQTCRRSLQPIHRSVNRPSLSYRVSKSLEYPGAPSPVPGLVSWQSTWDDIVSDLTKEQAMALNELVDVAERLALVPKASAATSRSEEEKMNMDEMNLIHAIYDLISKTVANNKPSSGVLSARQERDLVPVQREFLDKIDYNLLGLLSPFTLDRLQDWEE